MKKVLIVTYYWPPAGGGGVQRVAKFCKYLGHFGWEPVVLTVKEGLFAGRDKTLVDDVRHVQSVYRARSFEPHQLYRRLGGEDRHRVQSKGTGGRRQKHRKCLKFVGDHVRLNVFVPDSRIGWLRFAVREGLRALKEQRPSLVFSSAPPYTAHLVAQRLKCLSGLPWVADFRDPWLENHAYNTVRRLGLIRYVNRHLENKVLRYSDQVVCVGDILRKLLQSKVESRHGNKFVTITNGYDRADVKTTIRPSSRFYLSHFGATYWNRFPTDLYLTVGKLKDRAPGFRHAFQLRFFGGVEPDVQDVLGTLFGDREVVLHDYVPHAAVLDRLYESQLLILPINHVSMNELIITGKLFEYITSGNPILGVGPTNGEAARILRKTGAGKMFECRDIDGMERFVTYHYAKWKEGTLNQGVRYYPEYERFHLTARLAELFDHCVGPERFLGSAPT